MQCASGSINFADGTMNPITGLLQIMRMMNRGSSSASADEDPEAQLPGLQFLSPRASRALTGGESQSRVPPANDVADTEPVLPPTAPAIAMTTPGPLPGQIPPPTQPVMGAGDLVAAMAAAAGQPLTGKKGTGKKDKKGKTAGAKALAKTAPAAKAMMKRPAAKTSSVDEAYKKAYDKSFASNAGVEHRIRIERAQRAGQRARKHALCG